MPNYEDDLQEAAIYLELAEGMLDRDTVQRWNPCVVNCIMAMIKTIDAAYLRYRGFRPKGGTVGHEATSQNLEDLYEEGDIDVSFKGNVDSVKLFVDQRKSEIQYKGASVSKSDADRAFKAAQNLFDKMKDELRS